MAPGVPGGDREYREGHVLKKEREAKEDGRYIIFYTFDDEGGES